MPYRPTADSREDQIRAWFQSRPELAKKFADKSYREKLAAWLRENGIQVTADDLTNPEVLAELGKVDGLEEIFPFTQDSIADKKREYYNQNPDQDPQSTTSKILEAIGLDEPYYNDSRSYDYRKKKWDESVKTGSPDFSWAFPAITDKGQEALDYSQPSVFGAEDDRSAAEKWQGAIMGGLSFPLWGTEEEAAAYFASIMNGTPYEEELDKSRRVKERHAEHTPIWSQVPEIVASLPLAAPVFTGAVGAAEKGIEGVRKFFGFAPKATTATGAAIQNAAAVLPATAAEASAYQLGEADGDLEERTNQYDPEYTAQFMMLPGFMAAGGAARGIISDVGTLGKKVGRYAGNKWDEFWGNGPGATVAKAPKKPKAPSAPAQAPFRPRQGKKPTPPKGDIPKGVTPQTPVSSVRDDIEAALAGSTSKRRK